MVKMNRGAKILLIVGTAIFIVLFTAIMMAVFYFHIFNLANVVSGGG